MRVQLLGHAGATLVVEAEDSRRAQSILVAAAQPLAQVRENVPKVERVKEIKFLMKSFSTFVRGLPEDERYEAIERAAIHEFDGKLSRADAEQRAMEDYNASKQQEFFTREQP